MVAPKTPQLNNFLKIDKFVESSHLSAMSSYKRLLDQSGNFRDWHQVMYRLYVGSIAFTDYFKHDNDVVDMINEAVGILHLMMVRVHCTGMFGFKVFEASHLTSTLALIDSLIRLMSPDEVKQCYNHAGMYLEDIMRVNKEASDLHDKMYNKAA